MDASKVRSAFQSTAESVGGDILRCCIECGEEPVINRDGLYDYIGVYGGPHGEDVVVWMHRINTIEELEEQLDKMGVPKTWS